MPRYLEEAEGIPGRFKGTWERRLVKGFPSHFNNALKKKVDDKVSPLRDVGHQLLKLEQAKKTS